MSDNAKTTTYRFILKEGTDSKVLQTLLTLALKESELIYGKARLKLETNCEMSPDRGSCTVDGGTECGDRLAQLLSGFLIRQLSEEGFRVERFQREVLR